MSKQTDSYDTNMSIPVEMDKFTKSSSEPAPINEEPDEFEDESGDIPHIPEKFVMKESEPALKPNASYTRLLLSQKEFDRQKLDYTNFQLSKLIAHLKRKNEKTEKKLVEKTGTTWYWLTLFLLAFSFVLLSYHPYCGNYWSFIFSKCNRCPKGHKCGLTSVTKCPNSGTNLKIKGNLFKGQVCVPNNKDGDTMYNFSKSAQYYLEMKAFASTCAGKGDPLTNKNELETYLLKKFPKSQYPKFDEMFVEMEKLMRIYPVHYKIFVEKTDDQTALFASYKFQNKLQCLLRPWNYLELLMFDDEL